MKKLSFAMMGLAIAGLMTFSSCKKPNSPIYNGGGEHHTVTFTASTGDGSKTTVVDEDIFWKDGDKINVNGTELTLDNGYGGQKSGQFTGDVEGTEYLAAYKATENTGNTATFNIAASQNYTDLTDKLPMAAYSTTTELTFQTVVNVLELSLTSSVGASVKTIEITSTSENLNGNFTVTKPSAQNPTTASGSKKITITPNKTLSSTATVVYAILPVFSADAVTLTLKFDNGNGDFVEKTITTIGATAANHLYTKEFDIAYPQYLYYTVNKTTHKRVMFAEKNLKYYDGAYRFAETHAMVTNWDANNVDLFCWNEDEDIARSLNGGTTFGDKLFTNLATFQVTGETAGYWRTLTADEWACILDREDLATANGVTRMVGNMKLNGVKGLVIFPDNYKAVGNGPGVYVASGYTTEENSYSEETWAAMVAAGARFLPVTSCRNGATIYSDEAHLNTGAYWGCNEVTTGNYARMGFNNGGWWATNPSSTPNEGKAIRLVHDLN